MRWLSVLEHYRCRRDSQFAAGSSSTDTRTAPEMGQSTLAQDHNRVAGEEAIQTAEYSKRMSKLLFKAYFKHDS